jgi:drug/metabolite transporter (DMT)-like permease
MQANCRRTQSAEEIEIRCLKEAAATPDLKTTPVLPYLWMLCGSLSFTLMSELTYALRETFTWQMIALTRAGLALIFASILVRASGSRFVILRPKTLWVRSLAGSLSLVSYFFALTRLPTSEVLTLGNMFPIWVAVLSWPMLGQAPTVWVLLSVASGVTGVVLIQQPHLAEGNFVALVALGASLFTAVAMMGLHRLRSVSPPAIVAHFSAVSLVFCVIATLLFDSGMALMPAPTNSAVIMLVGVGVTATIGQLFLTKAFAEGMPAKVSVVGLTQVVFAIIFDAVIWQKTFNQITVIGIVLVLAPTAWLLGRGR